MCVEISFELVRDPLRRGCCLETLLPLLWSHGLRWGLFSVGGVQLLFGRKDTWFECGRGGFQDSSRCSLNQTWELEVCQ